MGSIWQENYRRSAKKNSISSEDNHDLVRLEDQVNLTTNASGLAGTLIVGVPESGQVLIFNGSVWEPGIISSISGVADLSSGGAGSPVLIRGGDGDPTFEAGGIGGDVNIEGGNGDTIGNVSINGAQIGFFGVSPSPRIIISGSTGGNAALESLIGALESFGFILDFTS
jgi:hypothetical protein